MKRVLLILIAVLVALVMGAVGLLNYQRAANEREKEAEKDIATADRGDIVVKVVETGIVDAVKSVEVRSRASGRLAKLFVDEGERVAKGQLIAEIDPQEIEFRVAQDRAQLRGARSAAERTKIEISQRRVTAKSALDQAEARLDQLRQELAAQPTLTDAAVRSAQAAFNAATQDLERLRTTVHPTQRTAADSEVNDAQVAFDTARRERDRVAELEKKGYVSAQVLDAANLRFEQARIRLEKSRTDRERLSAQQTIEIATAEENVRRAQAELDRAKANRIQDAVKKREFESAMAAVESARAQLRDVEVLQRSYEQSMASVAQLESLVGDSLRQLRETQVRSPMDGIVAKRNVEVGDMVTGLSAFTQGTAIFRIEDRTSLRVKLEINEIDVARLRVGMPVQVNVDAYPDEEFRGVVRKIAPSSTALQPVGTSAASATADAVVKYQVEVYLDRTDPKLRSGMSAKCTFQTVNRKNALRIPIEFLSADDEGHFVMLAPPKGSKGRPKKTRVKIGAKSGAFVEIQEGLNEGDRVARPPFTGPKRKGFMEGPGDADEAEQQGESRTSERVRESGSDKVEARIE